MKTTESQRLLAEYLNGSEPAFRELVSRYLNLVYSTAIRSVNGDAHLAEDVAQTVFADLARMARSLSKDVMLGGWLHRHTCFVAATVMRTERRRQSREREAVAMNSLDDHSEANLSQLTPILDEAINQLGARDRTAILLRFFEQNDLRAVGEALGSSEDAAQKCVARALEKLRGLLKNRGVSFSATALGTILATNAVTAAPVGLLASISGTALASAAASGATGFTLFKILTMTKLKVGIVSAVVAVGVAVPLVVQQGKLKEENRGLRERVEQLSQVKVESAVTVSNIPENTSELSSKQLSELLKLRNEVGLLREQKQDLELRLANAAKAIPPARVVQAERVHGVLIPKDEWAYAGYATPEDALQSWSWAMLKGDSRVALESLVPEMQRMFAEEFEGKTDSELAAEGEKSSQRIVGYEVLGREDVSEHEAVLEFRMNQHDKAGPGQPRKVKFSKINGQWKVAGPVGGGAS